MSEKEEFWIHLFQDEPVSKTRLDGLQAQIMTQILSCPVNFGEELLLAKRRKLGLVLLGVLAILSLGISGLLYFKGELIRQLFSSAMTYLSFALPQVLGLGIWSFLSDKLGFITNIKPAIDLFWSQYSGPILGMAVVWILLHGFRQDVISTKE